jgi:hypothetical protein
MRPSRAGPICIDDLNGLAARCIRLARGEISVEGWPLQEQQDGRALDLAARIPPRIEVIS